MALRERMLATVLVTAVLTMQTSACGSGMEEDVIVQEGSGMEEDVLVHEGSGMEDVIVQKECVSGIFDALTRTHNGTIYAFRGEYVARLTPDGSSIASGYPKRISEVFEGLPSDLDAAVYWPLNQKNYFFKGTQYWRTTGTTVDRFYPRSIAFSFRGLPNDLDAALFWPGSRYAYIFKGSQYYRYNVARARADKGYPKPIEEHWDGYSDWPVAAATLWTNGQAYLLKGEDYWRYDPLNNRIAPGYPASTTRYWLGCPVETPTITMAGVSIE